MKAPSFLVFPFVLVTVQAAIASRLPPAVRTSSRIPIDYGAPTGTDQSPTLDEQRAPGVSVASNCSRCRVREEVINLTKEGIKQQILSKLGLQRAPNISGKVLPKIPSITDLIDMYGMQSDSPAFEPGPVYEEAEDDYHARTRIILTMAKKVPTAWNFSSDLHVQYFPLVTNGLANIDRVVVGKLWFYVTPSKASIDRDINIHVHHVQTVENMRPVLSHFRTNTVRFTDLKSNWYWIDINKLLMDWIQHSSRNRGLVVEAFDKNGRGLIHVDHSNESLVPYIEIHMTEEKRKRRKRMVGLNCEENSNEVRCCRYPLTVDFEEFGWDWIIAPKKYEANYCSGECPFVFLQKYPHTHLVQQANRSGSAGPCCAPRKMSSISMLYFDDNNNIIYGLLPGMVVDRCGCT
uniref:TGF-beta family profile domain-containing protein n=1 Tax=Strigamia maritima TaxID=126957 RepID=T1IHG0_STRMM